MKKEHPSFKDYWIKLDDKKWTKWKKRSKKKNHGLNKGDGGLPEGGPSLAAIAEAISFSSYGMPNSENEEMPIDAAKNIHAQDQMTQQDDTEVDIQDQGQGIGQVDNLDQEDPDKQGIIRKVDGAHLVFKRKTEEDRYEELWIFKIDDNFKGEIDIKNDILAGTDIQPNKTRSDDGLQNYVLWTAGNVQFLHITGLPE